MDEEEKRKVMELYPEFFRLYGPYVRASDSRSYVVLFDGKRRSSRLLAKVRLEAHLGRRLVGKEEVDHLDEDPLNDNIENLSIEHGTDNKVKWHLHIGRDLCSHQAKQCVVCGTEFFNKRPKMTCSPVCYSTLRSRMNKEVGHLPPIRIR